MAMNPEEVIQSLQSGKSVENLYLDQAKKALGIESDYALAKALGVTQSHISKIRRGAGIGVLLAVKIAEILGAPPMAIIAATQFSQGKAADEKTIWEKYRAQGAHVAAALAIGLAGLVPSPSDAAPSLGQASGPVYIMLN